MQEKGVMLQDNSLRGPNNKSGAKALMNTIMQLRYIPRLIVRAKQQNRLWQISGSKLQGFAPKFGTLKAKPSRF